jgi:hypothetical protein
MQSIHSFTTVSTPSVFLATGQLLACAYQHGTMECREGGFLWDADHDGWDADDEDHPCPACNTRKFLLASKETAESVSSGSFNTCSYTGESIWLNAVRLAEELNPEAARIALAEIGSVETLRPADNGERFESITYLYA